MSSKTVSRIGITLGLAAIALWMAAQPAFAANQVVSDCGDNGGANQLRAKITAANATGGGTITFTCGPSITLQGGELPTISTNVTINGGGTMTISGQNASRIFVVEGGTLTLNNITLTNGYADYDGGAIYNDGGTLNINSSKFKDNQTNASYSGGAIFTLGPLHITNSEFANNKAGNGGALMLFHSGAVTTITGSNFHDNLATNTTDGWGGAILVFDAASATMGSTTFNLNRANLGGAVYVFANSSLTLNNNSTLTNNKALHGGGIYNSGAVTLTGVTLNANEADGSGGAIYTNTGMGITGSTLSNNKSLGASNGGGGIYIWGGTVTFTNSILTGNKAARSGGGILNFGTTTLTNTTLNANAAGGYGGGIYNRETATLTKVTLSGNEAGPLGGGIYNYSGDATITNSTFSGNSSTGRGGGLMNEDADAWLSNVTFSGNSAPDGGGIYSKSSGENIKNTLLSKGANGANCYNVEPGSFNLSNDASCGFGAGRDNVTNLNLGPLANNGGVTKTHLPGAGSAAIDQAQCTDASGAPVTSDQRGIARPQGLACDVGSVEVCAKPAKPVISAPASGGSSKKKVKIDWNDVVCATKYKILIKQGATNGPKVYAATVTVSQHTTTPLARKQTYYLRVSAINSAGKTKSDWLQFTTK